MLERKWSTDGMKQIIDTGFKMFDKQTNCLSPANCLANTMTGLCVRPYSDTDNEQHKPGQVLGFDVEAFSHFDDCNSVIKEMVMSKKRTETIKLYKFFINREHDSEVFGWGICTEHDTFLACGLSRHAKPNRSVVEKHWKALLRAMQYVSDFNLGRNGHWVGAWDILSNFGKTKYEEWVGGKIH